MNNSQENEYATLVKSVTPVKRLSTQVFRAFLVGGAICTLGQILINTYEYLGLDAKSSQSLQTISLILISVLLTGFNIFPTIVKFGGAGALVPITGFANSVCAPAIEYKTEGHVYGIGAKIFTIAGPVILYGIFSSFCLGLFYYLYLLFQ